MLHVVAQIEHTASVHRAAVRNREVYIRQEVRLIATSLDRARRGA